MVVRGVPLVSLAGVEPGQCRWECWPVGVAGPPPDGQKQNTPQLGIFEPCPGA